MSIWFYNTIEILHYIIVQFKCFKRIVSIYTLTDYKEIKNNISNRREEERRKGGAENERNIYDENYKDI